jgi:hypothetical protein
MHGLILSIRSAVTGTVLLGVSDMAIIKEVVAISSILPHELYDAETLENDIALVKLLRPAVLGGLFQCLANYLYKFIYVFTFQRGSSQ